MDVHNHVLGMSPYIVTRQATSRHPGLSQYTSNQYITL